MLPAKNPSKLSAWQELLTTHTSIKDQSIRSLFDKDQHRVETFSAHTDQIYLDYSKNLVSAEVMEALLKLVDEAGLKDAIRAMQSADRINERENRAVMHYALRKSSGSIELEGTDLMELVHTELAKIERISSKIHQGEWLGHTGKPIRNIVNIGIGGSDLGPYMVCNALRPYWSSIKPYFLSNIDAAQWEEIKEEIDAEETLFIIASKTFTTDETMTNARTARQWFIDEIGTTDALAKHFLAVSTNLKETAAFGIPDENIVGFWDWVGGRFSLWSSIGLSIACTVGYDRFKELLAGAEKMDTHLFEADFDQNLPVIMALLSIWNVNFCGCKSHAILPYDHRLKDFPRFLQQMIMESNGKKVDRSGNRVDYPTCPIYFGEPGTNGQHAFYQLLHQGTDAVPADFIVFAKPAHAHDEHHTKLIANCFAQSEALMDGSPNDDPFRNFEGNRPSNTLVIDELNPENLGALIALYEHQVFVQGVLWNIFSFDQWGVELGKVLAKKIVSGKEESSNPSTRSLLQKVKDLQ